MGLGSNHLQVYHQPSQATSSGQPWITMKVLPECLPHGAILPLAALLACPGFVMGFEVEYKHCLNTCFSFPVSQSAPRHSSFSSSNSKTLMIVWTKSEMALDSVWAMTAGACEQDFPGTPGTSRSTRPALSCVPVKPTTQPCAPLLPQPHVSPDAMDLLLRLLYFKIRWGY